MRPLTTSAWHQLRLLRQPQRLLEEDIRVSRYRPFSISLEVVLLFGTTGIQTNSKSPSTAD